MNKTSKIAMALGAPAGVAEALDQAVALYGIRNVPEFLGQMVVESKNFTAVAENMGYSAKQMAEVWPGRYATPATAKLAAREKPRTRTNVRPRRSRRGLTANGRRPSPRWRR